MRNSKNTVTGFRDYLGKAFADIDPTPCQSSAHPQKHESSVAFTIQDTDSDSPSTVTVSEITKRHIRRLASSATDYLGQKVNAAVITIPTDWKDPQKEALRQAAKEAGVEVLQFIKEPTAAVLAYDARPEADVRDKIVVVADLGGTRSDVAVIASRGGMYSILATRHDYETAGAQLDQVLIDHFAKDFLKKHKKDPREEPRSLAKLKLEAERTKKALSLGGNAALSIESLAEGIDYTSTINRTRYELLASKIFNSLGNLIKDTVQAADLDVLDIDEVLRPLPLLSPKNKTNPTNHPFSLPDHPLRRYIAHPPSPHSPLLPLPLPPHHHHHRPLHHRLRNRPLLPQRPRRRHPGLPHLCL